MKVEIYALPGFLGLPDDWNQVLGRLKELQPEWEIFKVDYRETRLGPDQSMRDWASVFNDWVAQKSATEQRVLVGYSMGGRLGLQAVLDGRDFWKCALFLSTNPGLQSVDEVEMRSKSDDHWIHRFETEKFEDVLRDWNLQPIFAGSEQEPERKSSDYPKDFLKNCLRQWSLARQEDLREKIFRTKIPQMWLAGERDIKFVRLVKELEMERGSRETPLLFEIVPGASHRLMFDQPDLIARMIAEFAAD